MSSKVRVSILVLAIATNAAAQWDTFDPKGPLALELAGSVLHQTGRWEKSAHHFKAIVRKNPKHHTALYFLAHALAEQGDHDGVEELEERTPASHGARALVLLELARARAAAGFPDAALEALERARNAQLVFPRKALATDAKLVSIRKKARFKAVLADVSKAEERFLALVEASDRDGLRTLLQTNACLWWPDIPTNLYLFKKAITRFHGSAKRRKDKAAAERLETAARAADEALGIQRFVPWIAAAVKWDKAALARYKKAWNALDGYARLVRSHRFAKALDTAEKIEATAKEVGDLLLHYEVQRAAGLVHLATIDYKLPRKGVTPEEEWQASRRSWLEYRQLATELRCPKGLADAADFLATLEITMPHNARDEAIRDIHMGIIELARVEPGSRELGMFEKMWRDLNERNDDRADKKR